jgi:Ca2+-binding RTX toxin-like protein
LLLAGPFDGPTALPIGLDGLETLLLQGGVDYDLAALDSHVDAGARLIVDARDLEGGDSLRFDAGDERDGNFLFLGGAGDDTFLGGAGEDRILGGMGADTLRGGGGADRFVYFDASESSSAGHDTLLGFNAAEDRIDLPVTVSGFDAAVRSGTLSSASFDGDLAAAVGSLGAGRAMLYSPDAGDLAGTLFLVVDGNGEAGYQAGEDFVFALPGAAITDIGASTAIFV